MAGHSGSDQGFGSWLMNGITSMVSQASSHGSDDELSPWPGGLASQKQTHNNNWLASQIASLEAADWWGASIMGKKEHTEAIDPKVVEGAFGMYKEQPSGGRFLTSGQHRDPQENDELHERRDCSRGEADPPLLGGEFVVYSGTVGRDSDDDEEDEEDEDEEASVSSAGPEMSRLKDHTGNLIPFPTEEYMLQRMSVYKSKHHSHPNNVEVSDRATVTIRENQFFRPPRETPGWMPGGRFLMHPQGPETIEDMQEREAFQARKWRKNARETDAAEKAMLLEREKMLTAGGLPSKFWDLCDMARNTVAEKQERLEAISQGKASQTLSREEMFEWNRKRLEQEIEDYGAGRGRRNKKIDEMVKARMASIKELQADHNQEFHHSKTITLTNVGTKFSVGMYLQE